MTIARAIALLAGAACFGRILARPFVEDLYWQQWLGDTILRTHHLPRALGAEAFTAPYAPYVPQEWLFSLLHAAALHVGVDLLVLLLPPAAATLALLLCVRRMEAAKASPGAQAIATIVLALVMITYMSVRVQIVVWPLFVALLASGEGRARTAWFAVPLTILWANLHASAAIAPAVVLLDALSSFVAGRRNDAVQRVLVAAASGLALLATPLGIDLPLYALHLATSPIRGYISEWRVLYTTDYVQCASIVLLAGAAAVVVRTWRERAIAAGRAIVFTALAFSAVRYVPLFALAIAPLAALGFSQIFEWYRQRVPGGVRMPARLPGWSTIVVALLALGIGVGVDRYVPSTTPRDPRPAIGALARGPGPYRLYCDDFAWCSLALVHPQFAVFLDGRADPFPVRVWDEWSAIRWTTPQWRALLDRYAVDTVLTRSNSKLNAALATQSNWKKIAVPGQLVVWERDVSRRSKLHASPLQGASL